MYLSLLIVAVGLGFPSLARANTALFPEWMACQALLYKPIPYTPPEEDEIFDTDIRDIPGGTYYGPDEPLPDLETGRYLYQILNTGGMYLVSELDFIRHIQDGTGVWKHEVFGHHHRQRFGEPIDGELIASGWVIRAFGALVFISNGSGSRRGGPERVEFARLTFEAHGWKTDPHADFERLGAEIEETSRAISIAGGNADSRGRRHSLAAMTKDRASLEIMADVYTHPDGQRLIELYEELGRTLTPYMRSRSSAELPRFFNNPAVKKGLHNLSSYFSFPLVQARSADGIHHGIQRLWYNITRHQFRPVDYVNITGPIFVQGAINFLKDRLDPADLARLIRVRDGFAALPDWKEPPPGNLYYLPVPSDHQVVP